MQVETTPSRTPGRYVLHTRAGSLVSDGYETGLRDFVETLVRRGHSLQGADFGRLAAELVASGRFDDLDRDLRIDLRQARLDGADLRGAYMRGTAMDGASLRSAWIDDADFSGVSLGVVDLGGARARRTDMSGCELSYASLGLDENPMPSPPPGITFDAKEDAGRPQHRFLAQGINLRGANLTNATIREAQMGGANLEGACMQDVRLVEVNLDGADMTGLDLARALVKDSSLVSESVHLAHTPAAVLRNNTYARISGFKQALLHPGHLVHMSTEEGEQRARMPPEMRRDYDGSVAIAALTTAALPLTMAGFKVPEKALDFAVHKFEHIDPALHQGVRDSLHEAALDMPRLASAAHTGLHAAGSLLDSVGTHALAPQAGSWLATHMGHLLPMAPSMALLLGGAWVFKKLVDGAAEPLVRGALENVNLAREYWREGRHMDALGCVVGWGSSADKLWTRLQQHQADKRWSVEYNRGEGTVVVIGQQSSLEGLLRSAGMLAHDARLEDGVVCITRNGGPRWPTERNPSRVEFSTDGVHAHTRAVWHDEQGKPVREVLYDVAGQPVVSWTADGTAYPGGCDPDPWFNQQRRVVDEFMAGILAQVAPHDGRTHVARSVGNGSIIIRRASDGMVDNPMGPAVVSAQGEQRHFRDGKPVRVEPLARGPAHDEPAHAARPLDPWSAYGGGAPA